MARLHYYQFPDGVSPQTRWEHGAEHIGDGGCALGHDHDCRECWHWMDSRDGEGCSGRWAHCYNATVADAEDTISGITITRAAELLKKFGGAAWTNHIERDGGVFEVTDITLGGNNSRHKYNRHL